MLVRLIRASSSAARFFSTSVPATKKPPPTSTGADKKSGGGRDTLGKRLLSLVYGKRSAVITIRKWEEEGNKARKYQLNRIVRDLRKLKRYKHALEICEWMTLQRDMMLLPGDYALHLDLIGKVRGLTSAEKFFEDLPDKLKDQSTCSALLHTYVKNQLSAKAEALMKRMSECGFVKNVLPYNHMISLFISKNQLEKVSGVIQELKKNTSPDICTYNLWLAACASQNDVEAAEKVLLELKKTKLEPDWVTYSTMTNLYIKNAQPLKAESTLREMEKRTDRKNRSAYSSLLSLRTSIGDKNGVHHIWKKMKSTFHKLNDAEYTCFLSSLVKLGELEEAENLYTEWESVSPTRDTRVSNILLAAYINQNKMEMAENFYNRMMKAGATPSYTTWELLTWGYIKGKQTEKVLHYFRKAVTSVSKWNPDKSLIRAIFEELEEEDNVEGAEKLLVTLRDTGYVSTEVYNLLLRTYAKAGKMPLIVEERMGKDNVQLDGESRELIKLTSKMCVSELPSSF